jgi:hypothetical protein
MSSNATPDTIGPEIVSSLNWLVSRAEKSEGSAALAGMVEEICEHYRALAICLFADDGNVDDFFHWLLHSPLALKHYLDSVHAKGLGEPRGARASQVGPVLDAVAARQWKLATALVVLQLDDWAEGEEYEDDFCYGAFLRCMLLGQNSDALVVRWRGVLEGAHDPRLAVAEALRSRHAVEFEDALRDLVRITEARARELSDPTKPSLLAEALTFAPSRWVSIESLALLALAERAGIDTDFDIEGCPRPARSPVYSPFRSRAYPDLPLP